MASVEGRRPQTLRRRSGAPDDHRVALEIALSAGNLLLDIRRGLAAGLAPDAVRRDGDLRSHELLVSALADAFPGDNVLSEEGNGGAACFGAGRLWIIDPLDGTREFGEPGRSD